MLTSIFFALCRGMFVHIECRVHLRRLAFFFLDYFEQVELVGDVVFHRVF